jgi:hypothetical protein
MPTVGTTSKPAYVYDAGTDTWIPVGVGAHTHDTSALVPYTNYFVAGKNKIVNGDFGINQRKFTTSTTSGAFTFDRFVHYTSDGTVTLSAQAFSLGTAPVSGYEAKNFLQIASTSQTATSAAAIIIHKLEDVRTFAGQTTTFSFWAKASSGTPKVAIEISQNFGNGGGSSVVNIYGGQVTLSTSWARYSVTVNIPSISGKTIGTAADDNIQVAIWTSAGSDFNSRTGSLGIQTTTIQTWGWQWEVGSAATPFSLATGSLATELAACQRYYQRVGDSLYGIIRGGTGDSADTDYSSYTNLTTMRTSPTATKVGTWATLNCAQPAIIAADAKTFSLSAAIQTAVSVHYYFHSSATNYIELSAEL